MKGFSNPASLCKPMRLRMREETSEEEWNSTLELIDAPGSVVFSCKALDVIRTLSPAIADKIFNAGKNFADKYDALPRWLVCVSADDFASILKSMADVSEDQPNESFFDNFPAANGVEQAEGLKTDAGQMSEFIRKMSPYESIAFSAGIAMNNSCPCGDEIRHLSLLLINSTSCTNDRRLIDWAHNLQETLMKSLIELQLALKDDGVPY